MAKNMDCSTVIWSMKSAGMHFLRSAVDSHTIIRKNPEERKNSITFTV